MGHWLVGVWIRRPAPGFKEWRSNRHWMLVMDIERGKSPQKRRGRGVAGWERWPRWEKSTWETLVGEKNCVGRGARADLGFGGDPDQERGA